MEDTYWRKKKVFGGSSLMPLLIGGCLIGAFLINSEEMSASVYDSLVSSVSRVLPVLFPFMVTSRFLIKTGAIKPIENTLGRILARLFRIPQAATGGIILGALSSYPIGAMTVLSQYEAGMLSKDEAERAIFLAHNTGPSFPVAVIGIKYFGSGVFGLVVYASQLISAIIIGVLSRPVLRLTEPSVKSVVKPKSLSVGEALTEAISASSTSAVTVIGFIVFWESMIDLTMLMTGEGSDLVKCVLSSILEFSAAALNASVLGGVKGAAFCGFSLGFSGLSALMQVAFLAKKTDLNLKKVMLLKVLQGILTSFAVVIGYVCIFG